MALSEFGKAFAAARKAGDKEFTFGGKKFTTQMKGEQPEQESVGGDLVFGRRTYRDGVSSPRTPYSDRGRRMTAENYVPRDSYTRSGQKSFDTETEYVPKGADLEKGTSRGSRVAYESVKADQDVGVTPSKVKSMMDTLGVKADRVDEAGQPYKKGGKVKGWGKARGARAAKFY